MPSGLRRCIACKPPRALSSDRAYVATQLKGHKALQRLHTAITTGCGPAPERATPTLAEPGIKTHIAMIGMLQEYHRG